MYITKLQEIARLRRIKGLPAYMRIPHQYMGFGSWGKLEKKGVLDRWIKLLEAY